MYDEVLDFVRRLGIRSYQEIRLLLFLGRQPEFAGTYQQFCECLYMGDCPLMEQMIDNLQARGILENCGGCYRLAEETELRQSLAGLARVLEHPLTRQQLLTGLGRLSS